ncbi:LamG-like jellyroll fold domain-containing protein [Phaeocystidibacter luteus]|uniref:T9SS type B sorting domain-containing protein n=1 Tax=Phaeocystidibacter luteus TaxID=911197 RepID=A0A6N6RKU2_9FLAO|nr:LamG-like jellyroll fold domain-containing protein [Phaeocystidibacter luteus]KAB2809783.1 T9SS type B sorting domain-containing protein [Phaeocystidibacter luteus]
MPNWFIALFLSMCFLPAVAQNSVGPGNALHFDGVNDHVDLGPSLQNMTLPITVNVWVKPATQLQSTVFSSNRNPSMVTYHGLWLNVASDRVTMSLGSGSGDFSPTSRSSYVVVTPNSMAGEWIHIAAVFRGMGDMDMYINGEIQTGYYTGTGTTWSNSLSGNAWLGKKRATGGRFYEGELDHLSVWDRELTLTEIRDIMTTKITASVPDLLMAYDLNEAAGSNTFTNIGSAGTTGTRIGATTIQSTAPIGDTSVYAYATSGSGYFTNQSVTLEIANQEFIVSSLAQPSHGVHLYRIDNDPSITGSGCVSPHAWGIWVADTDFSTDDPFDVVSSPFILKETRDNIADTWQSTSSPATGITSQAEFSIEGQLTVQLFPEDTTICPGQTVPISLPNGFSYAWDDGNTSASRTLGPGTYIVTASAGGCSAEDTLVITEFSVNALPFTDTTTCDSVLFVTPAGTTVIWPDGGGGNRYLFPGTYTVSVTSGNCSFVETIVVGTASPENIPFFPTYSFCEGESLNFSVPSSYSIVTWSDGYVGNQRTISESGTYEFTASSSCGDVDVDFQVFVENCDDVYIYLPNAFTPNGDGMNDVYFIENLAGLEFTWTVFDRWGAKIYQTSDPDGYWDGTFRGRLVSEGAYPIILKYKTRSGEFAEKTAFINVFR